VLVTRIIPVIILFCVVLPTRGQTPVDQDDVIRVDTDVTNLLLTATDKQRRFLTTLRAEDIKVFEDGAQQQIFTFERETNRPLALAFLIDVSSSEERTLPLEKRAARLFIERVIKSTTDQAAIIPFTGSAFLEQPLTHNVLGIYRALERVEIALPMYTGSGLRLSGIASGPGLAAAPLDGTTAIWEAIFLTSRDVLAPLPPQGRRAIILLTDGHDTTSRVTRSEGVESVIGAEAVIYAIGIGDSKQDGVNRGTLKDIAERTGGRAFFPKKEEDLNAAFAEIEQELRTQYLIAYSSSNKNRDGSYRKISVEITNPDLLKEKVLLRHRPGYFATSIR
jgi:Ca-activated chloride channel homolog